MSEPGVLVGGHGRGGYGPFSRFGQLELLLDPRRTFGLDSKTIVRTPDFSPHGLNYLDNGGGTGWGTLVNGINGRPAFDMTIGAPAFTGSPARVTLPRPIGPLFTLATVLQFHSLAVNAVLCAEFANGPLLGYTTALNALFMQTGSDPKRIGGGVAIADTPLIMVCIFAGAASRIRINRVEAGSGVLDAQVVTGLRFGSVFGGGATANARMGICAVYQGVPRDDQLVAIETILDREYAIGAGPV